MKKKTARFLAAVLILAMMLGACSSAPKNNEDGTADGGDSEGAKDTLVIGNYCEPTVLDPPNQNILSSGVVNVQIFDGLAGNRWMTTPSASICAKASCSTTAAPLPRKM